MKPMQEKNGTYKIFSEKDNIIQVGKFIDKSEIDCVLIAQRKMSDLTRKKYFIDITFDEKNYENEQ